MQLKAKAKAKAKTVKMAEEWKKTRDGPVSDDDAEGEDEGPKRRMQQLLMMSIEATPR